MPARGRAPVAWTEPKRLIRRRRWRPVSRFRVPFGAMHAPGEKPEDFDPGVVLATAAHKLEASSGSREQGTVERTLETPWGSLQVEARGRGEIVVETPAHALADRPVMLQAACRQLGIDAADVEASKAQIREVDVGRDVLVVPFPSADRVREVPETADPSGVPMVDAAWGVVYARTQTSPYVKILARAWGGAEPMTALAAAALHLVTSGTFRPTYPRTRVVGQILNHGEEACEITVQAEKVGGEPKVTRLLVGGEVTPVDDDA